MRRCLGAGLVMGLSAGLAVATILGVRGVGSSTPVSVHRATTVAEPNPPHTLTVSSWGDSMASETSKFLPGALDPADHDPHHVREPLVPRDLGLQLCRLGGYRSGRIVCGARGRGAAVLRGPVHGLRESAGEGPPPGRLCADERR